MSGLLRALRNTARDVLAGKIANAECARLYREEREAQVELLRLGLARTRKALADMREEREERED